MEESNTPTRSNAIGPHHVQNLKQDLLMLLSKLITFETVAPKPFEIIRSLNFVADYVSNYIYKQHNYLIKSLQIIKDEKYPNLIISNTSDKTVDLILTGHIDVVPAAQNAFAPTLKDNKLYGRGASDMKGPLAAEILAFIYTFKEATDRGIKLALIITGDEEVGGFNGMNRILNHFGYYAPIAFLPDGGDNWHLVTDEKGLIFLHLKTKGKSAHGAYPWLGDNAIERLISFYNEFTNTFSKKFGTTKTSGKWTPTINIGKLHGGDAFNKVADKAEMGLDIRYPAPITHEQIMQIVEKLASKYRIEYSTPVTGSPMHNNVNNPLIQQWLKIASKHREITPFKGHGASDGRWLSQKHIQVLMVKPTCSAPHVSDEWIDIDDLTLFTKILIEYIATWKT